MIFVIVGLLVLLFAALILFATKGFFRPADALFGVIQVLPTSLTPLLQFILQTGSLGAIIAAVALALFIGKLLLARSLAFGGALAWILTTGARLLLAREANQDLFDQLFLRVGSVGSGIPSRNLAIVAALATIADPFLSKAVRRFVWGAVLVVTLAEFLSGTYVPLEIIGGLALGIVIGALTNLLLGVPQEDVSTRVIREAFDEHEIKIKNIKPVSADARGSVPYFAQAQDGQEYFVKLLGTEQRNADFLFKLWRTVLLKDPASSAPFLTPVQQIEHEAYLSLLAQKHEVRTPDVEFTTRVAEDYALLAQKRVPGRILTDLREEEITDALLTEIWRQVLLLHEARIYHGDLRVANILIDEKNQPWLIDFGFAAAGADDPALGQETAQILASMAPVVGVERTVNTALQVLGPKPLQEARPALEPLALSTATRENLKIDPTFLDELQEAIAQVTPSQKEKEKESVFRVRKRSLLFLLGMGAGVYFLLPQLGQFNKIVEAWRNANPLFVLLALAGSVATYIFAAVSQQGAVEKTLSFWQLTIAQFAATFGSRFSPQAIGGAYVNEQFIEKSGVPQRKAVTALTVNGAAGAVVHIVLALIALALVGISGIPVIKDIQPWQIAIGVGVLLLVVLFFVRFPDKFTKIRETTKDSIRDLIAVLQIPLRAVQLLGGSAAITLAYIATFLVSLWAIGANVSPVNVAAIYLAGSIIGTASPTPGGLGAIEAAFVAGLTAFGVPTDQAVAGTLLYRLITFWLPIIPGFFAFRFLQKIKKI